MNSGFSGKYRLGVLLVSSLLVWTACKKEHSKPPMNDDDTTAVQRRPDEDSLKFYVWYINESDSDNLPLYYWYDQVPELDPFSSLFPNADSLLSGRQGIAGYPVVGGKKVDKYSFLDRSGSVAGELEGGVLGDFGMEYTVAYDTDDLPHIVPIYVYAGSPAGKAGVQRGWDIIALDGNTNMTLDGGANSQRIVKALYDNESTTFTFKHDQTEETTVKLTRTTYHINPVLLDSVYTVGAHKVGYFVYNSFVSIGSDANGMQAKAEIDAAFDKFKAAGITELIVDLRYNGGGSVASSEYLDNLIAPAAANGKAMYKYLYNDALTSYFSSTADLKKDYIDPINFDLAPSNLNLSRVFFIVGPGTASASELTINNLKPYMDVKILGQQTYGKPVGFFVIPIEFVTDTAGLAHVADMYAINFETVNSAGGGQYYQGMTPDQEMNDYVGYNWGDLEDPRLAAIISYISTGSYARSAFSRRAGAAGALRQMPGNPLHSPHAFNGMVSERLKGLPLQRLK